MTARRRVLAPMLLAALLLGPAAAQPAQAFQAQADTTRTREALVSADFFEGLVEEGEAVRRLIGNVRVRQDSTFLSSRRALQYTARQTFLFTGSVLIVEKGDSLRADTVFYDKRTKVGRARGRVYLTDGDVQVRAPSGLYFVNEKRARFEDGLTLVDSTAQLTSRKGTYWSDDKRAELDGAVHLTAERTYLEADSLTYFRETEVSVARGNVFIKRIGGEDDAEADSTLRTLLFGGYAYNDEQAGYSQVEGRPLLLQLRQDSTGADLDTLLIRARRLESLQQDSLQRLVAVDSVQIWKADFAALADSVVYERFRADTLQADTLQTDTRAAPEETRLFGRPMAWVGQAQVSGDTLRVKGREGSIDSLFVRGGAFVAQRDTLTGRIQQLKGLHLTGAFEDDSTRTFVVGPNAEAIYFQRDDEDRPDGGLRASGDVAVFRFQGESPRRIDFAGDPQGTYYAEDLLPTPFQLDGFRWLPERRPTRAGLLREQRILRRLEQEALPPPSERPFQAVPPVEEAARTTSGTDDSPPPQP